MKTRTEAKDRAKELAFKHADTRRIAHALEKENLGGLLDQSELDSIVAEVKTIQRMLPETPRKTLPRIIGIIAVILGCAAIWIEASGPHVRRYSPGGYGIAAVILGIILIVKPSAAKTDL